MRQPNTVKYRCDDTRHAESNASHNFEMLKQAIEYQLSQDNNALRRPSRNRRSLPQLWTISSTVPKQFMDNMNRHKMSKQTLIHGKDRGMVTLVDDLKTIDKATQNANADRAKTRPSGERNG